MTCSSRLVPSMKATWSENSPVLLIIMDGWGMGSGGDGDAVTRANTPTFDRLWSGYPHTTLLTHGPYVGLSSSKDMGGSEVGHLTMGAGMILDQGPTRINKAIADGTFFRSPALQELLKVADTGGTLHLIGLLSDGNIHSHLDHFKAVIGYAAERGVRRLRLHALLDGRDVGIQTAERYTAAVEALFADINGREGFDYRFASGGGRERVVMDRDRNWSKVAEGWELIVHGNGEQRFASMGEAIDHFRALQPGLVDQDMPGFVIVDEHGQPVGKMADGDAVVMANFRADRAIELTEAFELDDFDGFDRGRRPRVTYAGMMVYDEDRNLPALQIMGPTKVARPLGRRLVELGIRQFRLAETQKYAHVTFFFNGGYREPLDASLEEYILIPSDKVPSFAEAPAMQAPAIAEKAVALIASGRFGFGLINFANADMVGHCGDMQAAIRAVEAVDGALGEIVEALAKAGGRAIITADHGNAEEMTVVKADGHNEASTKHSINPVPCILFDPGFDGSYHLRQPGADDDVATKPGLSHLAATLLELMGQAIPDELAPSLIERD